MFDEGCFIYDNFLRRSPYTIKNNGNGINIIAINASTLVPQPSPREEYIRRPASGKNAPTTDRRTVFAATAEAEYSGKASTR